jgi:Golgi SNAP receptor complex protein 1
LAESGLNPSVANTEDEATLRHDIQRTHTALEDLVKLQMQPAADRVGNQSASLLVKRYREILFDLKEDFERSRSTYSHKQERAQLMSGARTSLDSGAADDPAMEHLMRERNHIANSQNAAASVINQASEIRSDLRNQGQALGRVTSTMGQIAGNIPGLNTVMEQIKRKRSKDDKIVAGVIAFCILFTLWYLFG